MSEQATKKERRKSIAERELGLREAGSRRWDEVIQHTCTLPFFLLEKLCTWPVAITAGAYFFFVLGGEYFGGKNTSLLVSGALATADSDWPYWVAIGFLIATNGFAWYNLRRSIKQFGAREKELERLIDPNRTSSGLTETGDSPKDKGR